MNGLSVYGLWVIDKRRILCCEACGAGVWSDIVAFSRFYGKQGRATSLEGIVVLEGPTNSSHWCK